MVASLDSSRPIMAPSVSSKGNRFSTYSQAISVETTDSAREEITAIEEGFDKLHNKKLESQRCDLTTEKRDNMGKLALGAKLERALGRRMGSQDAVMRKKSPSQSSAESPTLSMNEKTALSESEKENAA
ncbi:uncharacterized protein Bfra_004954 [Botrytis fragariae]|uniref:Uncharacterized protein n=3 Tax=Botrytis TaxID=33196 RepID=A0A4Z1KXF2_9HELO|nr:uncharacterized protein Bfra_004954 [Botrytis fragariae]XP_038768901.1 uncharacterized protein EAF01_007009 [Botrytis porri]KAF7949162.1 hypothetical protein EAE96_008330 [Botrytis aclada]TGO34104.1 hypothetical protein BHYA_0212g00080 [Botrytis hyacinthi]KAF5873493.1 hypothetical protein Bfra_004954 [Botrytis fragariae]KAF7901710.1 hypothetical protein EAF01_007009 [Botrytis porri]TGO89265.1 hypothetical protein BPOR_0117g00130 [Botrytis porri]